MLAGTIISGLAVAMPAMAQDAATGDTVVVTGSRIKSKNLVSTSPVTVVGAAEVKASGATRVEDMVNNLPQVFAADGAFYSNGATGTATVNLRGLGTQRTLVLVNGTRMQPGSPVAPAADINQIPAALIDRVEILTGGASAVYGSDAVAGVVNFILKKNFQGVQLDVNHTFYQHKNDGGFRQVVLDNGYEVPKKNVMDGDATDITLTVGSNFDEDKGNATAYLSYRNIKPLLQSERDFSACSLLDLESCGGSSTSYPGRFVANGTSYAIDYANGLKPWSSAYLYNYQPTNYYQRPDEKYAAGFFVNYEVNPAAKVRIEAMMNDDHSVGQIAASGIFYGNWQLNCNNPLLPGAVTTAMACSAGDIASGATKTVRIGRRLVESGGRQYDMRHTAYSVKTGIGGDLFDVFNYDINAQYGTVDYKQVNKNQYINSRIQESLLVNPDGTCTSGNSDCSALDIWHQNGLTQSALDYITALGISWGSVTEQVVTATFGGDLTTYGAKTPWAEEGVKFNLGTEYRRDTLSFEADDNLRYGLLAGSGGPTLPVNGAYNVTDLFAEAIVPIISDKPFAKQLNVELGARTSDYSTSGRVNSWKAMAVWKPYDDVMLRLGKQRAVRAPNLLELYTPQSVQLTTYSDPCAGPMTGPDAPLNPPTVAECVRAGVPAAQYGNIEANDAGQYQFLDSGEAKLTPEIADTVTLGVVYTPSFLKGFNISVDYFDVKIADRIGRIGNATILENCMATGDAFYCNKIHRDSDGSLFISTDGYIDNHMQNTGEMRTNGFDIQVGYGHDLPSGLGKMSYSYIGTIVNELSTKATNESEKVDCAGMFDGDCGYSNPKYRHKLMATWKTPWDLNVSTTWRYFGSVKDSYGIAADGVTEKLKAYNYFDLYATYNVTQNATFNIGVNNVFDKDPPVFVGDGTNANTYPQSYDPLGRYIFMGLRLKY